MDEDSITPDSERGDLLSPGDSEGSEDEEDALLLLNAANWSVKGATEKSLEHNKRKKLIGRFPLPVSDAAHTPKLDKDILALIP